MDHIVFLDRASLRATVRAPAFAHRWTDFPATGPDEVAARLADATIAITNKVPLRAAVLARLPALRMIAVAATGTDNVDLAAAQARRIAVCNIRGYALRTVPEHCFALLLAVRRNLLAYRTDVAAGRWQQAGRFCLFDHPIRDLAGSRLGIIGLGALGQAVARLGQAFGMEVVAYTRTPVTLAGVQAVDLATLLRTADVVSLHVPLTPATRVMIGAAELATMKRTAVLINTARGGLVDEAALAAALRAGSIGGAGFDVLSQEPPAPDHPLLQLDQPNFVLTPHNAWASDDAMQALADQLVDNLDAFAAGRPRNLVG